MRYLDAIAERGRDANPFFRMMGVNIGRFGDGKAEISMDIRPEMQNGVGWLQGGMFVALADEAMALALYTVLEEGEGIATVSESTSFLKGAREGRLIATGRVVKKGRRIAFTEGEVRDAGSGTVYARTSAAFVVTKA
ncbi:MAG: PaaI family thioesterase [Methanomicrobiaceae archaeon]|nr:PaaI family thioesterase [Methanomicrobiaceae archaeon]MDD5419542.1 PaaI family thioesterase [Methanomicrobiaceae archaeon]